MPAQGDNRDREPRREPVPGRTMPAGNIEPRRVSGSESIVAVRAALREARKAFLAVKKDKDNTYHKSRYADLAGVLAAVSDALDANGLIVLHSTRWEDGELWLDTTLEHESGEYLASVYPLFAASYTEPQKIGSALTYARRYVVQMMLGIAPADDDGETAMGRGPGRQEPRRDQRPQGPRRDRDRPRDEIPDRRSINEAFKPAEAPGETWPSYIGPRLRAVQAGWMREMVAADVPPDKREENKELAREPQMVNHLCTRLIELGRITGTAIGKDGNPEVRDAMRARSVVMQAFAKSPAAIMRAVDKHLAEKLDEARTRLGMPSSGKGEGREPEGVPAGTEEHWPAGRE
jgi:hypothetical protein